MSYNGIFLQLQLSFSAGAGQEDMRREIAHGCCEIAKCIVCYTTYKQT